MTVECFLQALLQMDMWVRHTNWLFIVESFAEWHSLCLQLIYTIANIFQSNRRVLSPNTSHNTTHVTFWGRWKFMPKHVKVRRQHVKYLCVRDRRKILTVESLLNLCICFLYGLTLLLLTPFKSNKQWLIFLFIFTMFVTFTKTYPM